MISDAKALRVISILFLLGAVSSIIGLFLSFGQNRIVIPWGILGFWIYFNLPAYRGPWRGVAMALLLIPLITFPVVSLAATIGNIPTYIQLLGIRIARVPLPVFLLWAVFFWAIHFWQFRVLMRPSIRQGFNKDHATTPQDSP